MRKANTGKSAYPFSPRKYTQEEKASSTNQTS